jgi:hypothetical protein
MNRLLFAGVLSLCLILITPFNADSQDDPNMVEASLSDQKTVAIYTYDSREITLPMSKKINRKGSLEVKVGKVYVNCAEKPFIVSDGFTKISDRNDCDKAKSPVQGDTHKFPQGGYESEIPYIISPRFTLTSLENPGFQWNHVEAATSYSIQLYSTIAGVMEPYWDKKISIENSSTLWNITDLLGIKVFKFEYPLNQKLLQPATYYLEVNANLPDKSINSNEQINRKEYNQENGIGAKEKTGTGRSYLEFKFKFKDKLTLSDYDSPPTAQANRLTLYGFYDEAIQLLLKTSEIHGGSPSLYRRLSEIYAQNGLSILAKNAHQKSIAELKTIQDKSICEREVPDIQEHNILLGIQTNPQIKCG